MRLDLVHGTRTLTHEVQFIWQFLSVVKIVEFVVARFPPAQMTAVRKLSFSSTSGVVGGGRKHDQWYWSRLKLNYEQSPRTQVVYQ